MTFPDKLEMIGLNAFQNTGLWRVEFPCSLKKICQGAFCECRNLRTVKFSEGLEALGTDDYLDNGVLRPGVFENSSLNNVRLPSTLKRIEYSAFQGCSYLSDIYLPENLELIGQRCFHGSGLESVRLPPALTVIGDNAFGGCKFLW